MIVPQLIDYIKIIITLFKYVNKVFLNKIYTEKKHNNLL